MDQAFKDRGHEVFRVDIEPSFKPDLVKDVLFLACADVPWPDVVLAGHPCECFSVASIGTHWGGGHRVYAPKSDAAKSALKLLDSTISLIDMLGPKFWVLENPRGVMRKVIPQFLSSTVWYCRYGDERAKPTDLFGKLPISFVPLTCRNGNKDHIEARRGAKTGTQGRKDAYERSKMPALSLALCLAIEKDLNNPVNPQLHLDRDF